jgi:thiamine kinase-like enzyme
MSKVPLPITEEMSKDEKDLITAVNRIDDWKGLDLKYEPVPQGITNSNFKLTIDGKSFFIKIPGAGTEAFIDRNNCHAANLIAAKVGIGPGVVYYFEDTGIEVTEWLEGYRIMTWGDAYNKDIFHKTADVIRFFNDYKAMKLPLTQTAFEQTFKMLSMARELNAYLPPDINRMEFLAKEIENAIQSGGIDYKPCHNDLWNNNYSINDETGDVKLLDFEYASMNDECYDMGIYSGMDYFTEEMDVEFIKRYYGFFNEEKFARLKLYKLLADIKWSMWAVVQDKIATIKFDYMNWFGMKIARLRGNMLDPRLDYWINLVGKNTKF